MSRKLCGIKLVDRTFLPSVYDVRCRAFEAIDHHIISSYPKLWTKQLQYGDNVKTFKRPFRTSSWIKLASQDHSHI